MIVIRPLFDDVGDLFALYSLLEIVIDSFVTLISTY